MLKVTGLFQLILSVSGAFLIMTRMLGNPFKFSEFLPRQFTLFLFFPFFILFLISFWKKRKLLDTTDRIIFISALIFGLPDLIMVGYSLLFMCVVFLAGGIDNP